VAIQRKKEFIGQYNGGVAGLKDNLRGDAGVNPAGCESLTKAAKAFAA
jgi:hypothetical protein